MKKIGILMFGFLLIAGMTYAQDVREGTYAMSRKVSGNALTVEIQGQDNNIEEVLKRKFKEKTGEKGKTRFGLISFEGARYSTISSSTLDYYIKVEKASKGDNARSIVYLFLSAGNNNFLDSNTHPDEMISASEMLENLQYEVTVYEFELAIEEQSKLLSKAAKEHERMVKDSVSLEKRLKETQEAIIANKEELQRQKITLREEQDKLADFKREFARVKEDN